MNTEQKSRAFDMLCNQVRKSIEGEIPNWLNENPCFEVDDEDQNGNRSFHYPKTTENDARSALCESLLNQADDMGFYDFFEFVLHEVYGEPIRPQNAYREKETPFQTKNIMNEIISKHFNIAMKAGQA